MIDDWKAARELLRARLAAETFETWIAPVVCDAFDGRSLVLRVPNRFYAEWIRTHYLEVLLDALRERAAAHTGNHGSNGAQHGIDVQWNVDDSLSVGPAEPSEPSERTEPSERVPSSLDAPPPSVTPKPAHRMASELSPKYRFESFIVGPSNQLAYAAAMAAASAPGRRYNPLFIYGGVGLGKTHLVNAVGHRVLERNPSANIVYVSAERFTNEFIWALQHQRIDEFRTRYRRSCDVLLMDDVQFLATREQTQEEFFHTFNALYHSDKQIVVSSDAHPQATGRLQERLVSRFEWGMVADIQAPELDTRIAIVRKKAEDEGITLSDEVAQFLALSVKSNVRELEGTLLRLAVRAELLRKPIDLELARESLHSARPTPEASSTAEDIQRAVCAHFQIRLSDLCSQRRQRSIAKPRMIAMYLCRQRLNASYSEIGERFGGKDHTTVMSAVRRIESLMETDHGLASSLEVIERRLNQR